MMVKQRNNRHALVKNDNPKTSVTEVNEIARINDEIVAMKKQITTIHQSLVDSIATSCIKPNSDPPNVDHFPTSSQIRR